MGDVLTGACIGVGGIIGTTGGEGDGFGGGGLEGEVATRIVAEDARRRGRGPEVGLRFVTPWTEAEVETEEVLDDPVGNRSNIELLVIALPKS